MALSGGDPALLRRLNSTAVIRQLHGAEELTLTELVRRTAISRATIEGVLVDLTGRGLVEEVASVTSDRRMVGRPARRFRFRAEQGHVVGLDIGPHKVLAITADLTGTVIDVRRSAVDARMGRDRRLSVARAVVRRSLRAAGLTSETVRAIGVASTGIVDQATGRVVLSSRLPDWAGLDLPEALGGPAGTPVVASNDTRLAAMAERWRGVARDVDDLVYVHAGQSISVGVLVGGRLLNGHNSAAGEIGNLRSVGWYEALDRFDDFEDPEPGTGSVTGSAAGSGPTGTAAERVFAAARRGSGPAIEIIGAFAHDLARGVAATVLTVDPELVVVGGGLSRAADLLLPPLRDELARLCLFPVRVEASSLGPDSAALGAVRLALDRVEHELFDVHP